MATPISDDFSTLAGHGAWFEGLSEYNTRVSDYTTRQTYKFVPASE